MVLRKYRYESFLEIYNERVQDLLCENKTGKVLRVREHPKKGPYVEGLQEHLVTNVDELLFWIKQGESIRRVASTLSNKCSSRSHSVLTISCRFDSIYKNNSPSRLHLVDLAGSERASSVQNSSCQLKEGANINRSLVALGNVISALADNTVTKYGTRFVPYRDSILTWLLKETLGGNSNTFMIATVSPSSTCYSETVNTLRFGQRAKNVVNEPTINEDPTARIIRELREEIAQLKLLLLNQQNSNMGSILQQIKAQNIPIELNNIATTSENRVNDAELSSLGAINRLEEMATLIQEKKPQSTIPSLIENPSRVPIFKPEKSETNPSLRRTYSVLDMKRHTKRFNNIDRHKSHETLNTLPVNNSETTSKIKNVLRTRDIGICAEETEILKTTNNNFQTDVQGIVNNEVHTSDSSQTSINTETANNRAKLMIKDAIRRHQQNKRSEIVASVTERLYSKARRKSNTSEKEFPTTARSSSSSLMSDLSICSNARTRLQEISLRALNVSRRSRKGSHVGTQTDLFRTIRMKEIGIDTPVDMLSALNLTKEVSTETKPETETVAVGSDTYLVLDKTVETCNVLPAFKLTRSCGNITDVSELQNIPTPPRVTNNPKPLIKSKTLSFTKYITNATPIVEPNNIIFSIPSFNSQFYNTSVNIKFNCNLDDSSADGSISDDSLDGNLVNTTYQTPDLLNNHNSVDNSLGDSLELNSKIINNRLQFRINYAVQYGNVEYFETVREQIFSEVSYCYAWIIFEKELEKAVVTEVKSHLSEFNKAEIVYEMNLMEQTDSLQNQASCIPSTVYVKNETISRSQNTESHYCTCQSIENQTRNSAIPQDHDLLATSTINFLNEATYFLSSLSEVTPYLKHCACHNLRPSNSNINVERYRLEREIIESASTSSPMNFTVNKWEKNLELSCDKLESKLNHIDSENRGNYKQQEELRKKYNYRLSKQSSPRAYLQELQKMRKELIDETRKNVFQVN